MKKNDYHVGEILCEFILTFFPIGLLFLVFSLDGDWRSFLGHEEWLFISAVLAAQTMGKLFKIVTYSSVQNKPFLTAIALGGAFWIVLCTLIVSRQVTTSSHVSSNPAQWEDHQTNKFTGNYSQVEQKIEALDARLKVIEIRDVLPAGSEPNIFWRYIRNILSVLIPCVVFIWASILEKRAEETAQHKTS